jgi:integrase
MFVRPAGPTPAEIRLVLRAANNNRNGHLWYLALSGLRRGEIAGLRWEDIDFEAGTIAITRNRVQAGARDVGTGTVGFKQAPARPGFP